MEKKIEKIRELLNNNLCVKIYGNECEVIDIEEDDNGNPIGISVYYQEDLGGYGNYEEVQETITWEDLFSNNHQFYTEKTTRELVEI